MYPYPYQMQRSPFQGLLDEPTTGTSPYGGGAIGQIFARPNLGAVSTPPPLAQPPSPTGMFAAKSAPPPTFFSQGGVGRGIAGAIGDYLLQQAHAQPIFAPVMQQHRAQAQQAALLAQREMAAQYAPRDVGGNLVHLDQTTGKYVVDYAPPKEPKLDEFDQAALRAGIKPGTPEYLAASKSAFENKTDPFRAIPYSGPDGEGLIFKRSSDLGASTPSASGGSRTPSPAAIAALAAHPEKAAEFDAYYGAGASAQYANGGAVPGGAGSFPLYPARR